MNLYYISVVPVAALAVWVIGSYIRNLFKGKKTGAAVGPAPAPGETVAQALTRYAAAIEHFVQSSSHPRELLEQADFKAAVALLGQPGTSFDLVRQYATGASWPLACVALHVAAGRVEADQLTRAVMTQLKHMRPWPIYFALRFFNALPTRPAVGAPAAHAEYYWRDNVVITDSFREYFTQRAALKDAVSFGNALDSADRGENTNIEWLLYRVDHPTAVILRLELQHWMRMHLDKTFLTSFGRFWAETDEDKLLVVPDQWRERLIDAASAVLRASPRRSVLASGESRVGKTAFLKLLARILKDDGWTVFEASAAELQAGQMYIGQLEERIQKMIAELDAEKMVVWYVPDLLQIAESGTHSGQSASILDQVNQAVNAGKLVILSEATPAGITRLFQKRPSMRGAMELLRFDPMSEAETASLVRQVADNITESTGLAVTPEAVDAVLHLAHQYLGSTQLPGITLDLLKRSANHALSTDGVTLAPENVMETLSQASGLPRSVLDDNQRLDLSVVRAHFAKRVIGQDEAVSAVIDRIAMLKAGLVDPKRPLGVFLFAGPTGTGKTELAKTLASYLFGSPDRMARLDMSELQTAEATVKILGTGTAAADSLADKVRKEPFSVVLLDEFEKAHPNAWDLFLQVFDDGRLTDALGRSVDFRHTIIILTTNLGATVHAGPAFGFGAKAGAYSADQILLAVGKTFRPEFVNRLDKILVFRPLSRDFMREILEKELAQVLERRGLRQRDWAVEYEDSAINFLLDKGFTPDMGARPLRRAIDEYLLAPLAGTMVEHRYPAGDQFLFVRSDGKAIQVEFVDPDADDTAAPVAIAGAAGATSPESGKNALARAILASAGDPAEVKTLAAAMAAIDARIASQEWIALKDALSAAMNDAGVWQRMDRARIFSQYELMDRVLEARRTAERLLGRLGAGRSTSKVSRDLVSRLALQLHLVSLGIDDALADAPIDALLVVEPVVGANNPRTDAADAWCAKLRAMYRGWAGLRHMRLNEIAPPADGEPILEIAGFGALRVLNAEAGLHVWEDAGGQRLVARVRVSPGVTDPSRSRDPYEARATLLAQTGDDTTVLRRYRRDPDPLVRDAKAGWRSGRLEAILAGNFDLIGVLSE